MLRAGDGCRAGVSGSTGTEGVGEWYTALWPAEHASCDLPLTKGALPLWPSEDVLDDCLHAAQEQAGYQSSTTAALCSDADDSRPDPIC